MTHKITFMLRLVLLLALAVAVVALASGPGPSIDWWVLGGGGGGGGGVSVSINGTLGQTAIGSATTGSTRLGSGYWYAMQPYTILLPMIVR
jgi:hypothetical protein